MRGERSNRLRLRRGFCLVVLVMLLLQMVKIVKHSVGKDSINMYFCFACVGIVYDRSTTQYDIAKVVHLAILVAAIILHGSLVGHG